MIGSKPRFPKRVRYPTFLVGLAVIVLGLLLANSEGAPRSDYVAIVAAGFALLISSVVFK